MSVSGRLAVAALTLIAAVAVGCGETVIDDVKTEGALKKNLESALGKDVASVDCPSGVEVKAGTTFSCSVKLADGKTETAELRILNEDADVKVVDLRPSERKPAG